ncbi:MAG: response regulator [Chitinispirillaceae bacterium]|nr:response regulator [Chitinispirillaceae bacterium]
MNNRSKAFPTAQSATRPFYFIDRMLNILIVEDDPLSRDLLTEVLRPAACYAVHVAAANSKALELLRSGMRFHACIIDLGINDVENDEYYLLRHYGRHTSIIVLTGSPSPQKGASCIQLGARSVFEKGTAFNSRLFFQTLNRMVLINVVNYRFNEWSGDTLNLATDTLFTTSPDSVTQWAEKMRITDRQLRNLWHTGSGFGAKHVLFLFHCLKNAFAYYETLLFGNGAERTAAGRFSHLRLEAYFQEHHELLTFILS